MLGRTGNFEMIVFGCLLILLLQRTRTGVWGLVDRVMARYAPDRSPLRNVIATEPLARRSMPARGDVVLEAKNVSRHFGGLVANNDLSLKVHAGEILALIGPNGAGKSTMFNQLSGLDTPTSGQVLLNGQDVTGRGARAIATVSYTHLTLPTKRIV